MPEKLLQTKLYIPPARPQLVPRPRLIDQLNQGLHRKLTLVAAPPGFGKTTLMSEWQAALAAERWQMTWVSLDEQDNDPVRFWSYVVAALDRLDAAIGADVSPMLHAPQSLEIEAILTTLINAIIDAGKNVILVLDDFHLITADPVHQSFTFLIEHLPPHAHLALTSRTDPPLPLTRLRVRNQLTELRVSDLRFTPAEIATFLNQVMGLDLSAGDVAALEARTEGWVAGLQLAALSMQGRKDTHGFVQAFTGSHRYVIDYLAEEVLTQQPDPIQTFLLQTSILDRLSGPLCDALLNSSPEKSINREDRTSPGSLTASHSQEILEQLEQSNLFLIPLDDERRWYRYHHLFADFLNAQLKKTVAPAQVTELHRRAGAWYAAHGLTPEAIRHALIGGDTLQTADLIERVIIDMLAFGEVNTIIHWLEALPDSLIQERPRLSLGKGWAMLIINQWDQVEPYLNYAEEKLAPYRQNHSQQTPEIQGMLGEAAALRAIVSNFKGEALKAIELCRQALSRLPENNQLVRSIILMTLGGAYENTGDFEKAGETLEAAIELSLANDALVVAMTAMGNLANIQREQGHLHQAAETYRRAIRTLTNRSEAQNKPKQAFPFSRWAYLGLAEMYREQNELDKAQEYLDANFEFTDQGHFFGDLGIANVIQAQILWANGDDVGAMQAVQQAVQVHRPQSPVELWLLAVQARLHLLQGNLTAAGAWAQQSGLPFDPPAGFVQYPGEHTTLARILLAQEQFAEAAELLEQMHGAFISEGRMGRLLEVVMLQALTLYAQGKREQALLPLTQALTLAKTGGYVRLFVDEGPPMAQLLAFAAPRLEASLKNYAEKLLAAFSRDGAGKFDQAPADAQPRPGQPLIEPLSDREMEVLQLIAAGLSNQEIGDKLVIAEGTVKKHIHNIFGKLSVKRRSQAILRATDLGLI